MKNELINVFCEIDDKKLMTRFFSEIFTEAERKDFELRWELMTMLKEGVSQREIAAKLGISLCKITRGSKIVKNPRSATNKIFKS